MGFVTLGFAGCYCHGENLRRCAEKTDVALGHLVFMALCHWHSIHRVVILQPKSKEFKLIENRLTVRLGPCVLQVKWQSMILLSASLWEVVVVLVLK